LIQSAKQFPSTFKDEEDFVVRPVETVSFNEIRMAANNATAADGAEEWPAAPYSGSFLDLLRTKTGIDFDLPSETEWEFAARAGNGDTQWGDGSYISKSSEKDANLALLGCYKYNTTETVAVGSYKPNDWGLYDVFGNVFEWCLDWYVENRTSLKGAVNSTDTAGVAKRVIRGGSYNYHASACRPASRYSLSPSMSNSMIGLRLACRAGLD
jgi:formylglycine-generating enzyme required for sulfatase activity